MRVVAALTATVMAALTCGVTAAQAEPRPMAAALSRTERSALLTATRRFHDVRQAVAAGYEPTRDCVPGMGYHYTNPKYAADPHIVPTKPAILLYVPARHGTVRFAGLEYFRPDADGDLTTDDDRPRLWGHPFNGPMAGHHEGMPVHYDLHVWLYDTNPAGELATENPKVVCP